MPKITFLEADGTEHVLDAPEGITAMEAALNEGVPGIDGDCGGQCACATCHVYVDPAWMAAVGPADPETELPMIEINDGGQENSRLACQIRLTGDLDGLVMHVPEAQF